MIEKILSTRSENIEPTTLDIALKIIVIQKLTDFVPIEYWSRKISVFFSSHPHFRSMSPSFPSSLSKNQQPFPLSLSGGLISCWTSSARNFPAGMETRSLFLHSLIPRDYPRLSTATRISPLSPPRWAKFHLIPMKCAVKFFMRRIASSIRTESN